jgi:hypothetical protein
MSGGSLRRTSVNAVARAVTLPLHRAGRSVGGHDRRDRALRFGAAAEREEAQRPVLLDRLPVGDGVRRVRRVQLVEYRQRFVVARRRVEIARRSDDVPARCGNHSCDPNLVLADATTLVARREIAAGEEITSDYATMTNNPSWRMTCNCGAADCRRVVTG